MSTYAPHFHEVVRRLLLWRSSHRPSMAAPATVAPPEQLASLIALLRPAHAQFDQQALRFGHRYRSAYWLLYLLSSLAVLWAILPVALDWHLPEHPLHGWAFVFGVLEIATIGLVALVFRLGRKQAWQSQWLAARTRAELVWYMPLLAPVLERRHGAAPANWYLRLFNPGSELRSLDEVDALCCAGEELLDGARLWDDPAFAPEYARWAASLLRGQSYYHHLVRIREHALQHRVHALTAGLFGMTAVGVLAHLFVHASWLTGLTTVFPALGGALHGALAQSESFRLEHRSRHLELQLGGLAARLESAGLAPAELRQQVAQALALILDEHEDWYMLVRPHDLPLG